MTDNDPANDPIPGWPSPSEPAAAPEGPPAWAPPSGAPTYPGSQPPPAAGPPGAVPPGYGPPPVAPPGPGYGPPPGYGYGGQGYGGYPMAREHPQGTMILILGICGWVVCGLLAPAAWIMGNSAIKEIDRNPAAYTNRGNVQAGRILGMVYTIIALVAIALVGVLIIIGIAAGSTSS